MKKFYISFLHILLWVLGNIIVSHKAMAQYSSSILETGKYYTAIAKDNLNNVYIVAYNNATSQYQVLKYTNGAGAPTAIYQGLSFSTTEYPWSIAVNSAGDVFIMDPSLANNWQIVKLAAGTYTSSIIQSGRYFTALTVDASDNLLTLEYDAATTNYRVVKYAAASLTTAGTTLYNGLPLAVGSGTYPWGIVTDHSNNIYIIDFPNNAFNGRLIKLTAPGYAATTLGSGKGYTSLAIDAQDNLYTTESTGASTAHAMKYTAPVSTGASGTEIYPTLYIGSLFYPWGIAVTSQGNVFINDGAAPGNGRVIKLTSAAIAVSSVTKSGSSPTNANSVQYSVVFSAVATNVTTSAFSLTTTGLTGAAIASVTGSGTTYTVTVNTGTGDGTLRLDVSGTGMANNVSNVPYTSGDVYAIDKTAPTGTLTINSGATLTNATAVTLNITTSGATQMRFSTDNVSYSAYEAVATTKALSLPTGDGLKTVYMQLTDAVGNTQTYQAQITLDQTPPHGSFVSTPPLLTNNTTGAFTFTANETCTFKTSLDGGILTAATSPLTLPGLSAISHSLQLVATDLAGNVDLTPPTYTWVIDNIPPAVTSVSGPTAGYYHAGQALNFSVTFGEAVTVNTAGGTPSLDITIGSTVVHAAYASGTGTATLLFSYTVQSGDMDMDGIALGANMATNGGTIRDAATNNALLPLTAVNTTGVFVNTSIPGVAITSATTSPLNQPFTATITFTELVNGFVAGDITVTNATLSAFQTTDNITYTVLVTPVADGAVTLQVPANVAVNVGNNNNTVSNTLSRVYDATAPTITALDIPANGIYHLGEGLQFKAHFSESVIVTGTPTLDITIGSTTRQATYQGGSATDTLGFLYIVQAGDVDMDGIVLGALTGTINDPAGNNAVLTLPVVNTTGVLVNTNIPGVAITTAATSPLNQPFTATITFTELVNGFVAGDIAVTNATLSAFQTTDNITYTVLVTPVADGAVTLQVPANVAVNVGNNNNTVSNTLSRVYDATAPTITALDVPANGIYHLGEGLRFKAHFSESVIVTGTPTLDITIGSTTRQATYQGGSATDTLGFLYIVQAGDVDMDGIALGALIGIIKDVAGNNAALTLPVVNTTGVLVNTNIPGVAITTAATSPLNQPFTATITFTELVNGFVAGDITVSNATLSAFQTTDNITYTVLVTPVADGAVTVQVPANVAVNVGNNNNTASNTLSRVYDATAPTIGKLDVPANGTYHLGEGLRFKAHFTEAVVVTGTPTLDITIGSTTRQATYQGGSATDTLGFLYIVQAGDVDMDGIVLGTLTGTINDVAGNNAVLTLPAVNTTGVLVNTNIPGVAITTAATSPLNQPFTATITFTELVNGFVAGDITVSNATLSAFQTTDNITYTVLVTPVADGAVTLQVPANVAVNVGNNNNTASNILSRVFDGMAPTITALDVPANGIYHLGEGLRFKAHFSESVVVTGTPTLDITIGSTTRQATYQGGSATDTLGFLYIVQAGDVDMDGIVLGALTGIINDVAGNNAVLTLPAVNTTGVLVNTNIPGVAITTGATSPLNQPFTATITFTELVNGFVAGDITVSNATLSAFQTIDNITYTVLVTPVADGAVTLQVPANVAVNVGNNNNTASNILSRVFDGTAPTITALDVPANGIYHLGEGLRFKAHFTEAVVVTGTPTLDITIGSTTRQATYQGGSATDTLGFLYIVQAGDVDMDGIALGTLTGTINDPAGNNAILTLPVVNTTGVLVNTNIPGVAITTAATSPLNQPFTATITFTELVNGFVAGDITVSNATLSAFQTTDNITYTALVTPVADGAVTVQVPANVAVNVGNNNNTASNTLSRVYDATAPTITALDVPANGTYHLGEGLRFKAHFSESVVVTGTPTLDITIGSTTRQATYQGGSATDTLGFLYIVQAGDVDMDGIVLGALTGIINDVAGNNAVLTLPAVNTTGVLVNTTIPGVAISTAATSPLNQPFTATITFTELVNGFVAGDIIVTNATLSAFQTTDNITYTVLVTPVADGAITLQVPANVAVNVGNNNNTASNILSRVFDATAPTITALDVPANGTYHLGEGLRFKAHFSESVVVTGTPTLDITIGSTTRQATYQGGSATDTLGFLYIVQAGDVDMDGIVLGALTGTINDVAGNNAVLTLPAVNTTGVLVNTTIPGVAISTAATSPLNQPFTATITFTELVNGFVAGDITVTNATLSAFQTTDNITYTVLVTPVADGAVTIQVPANVAVNVGNNNNTTSNILSRVYDGTAPTITALDIPANGTYHLGEGLRFKAHFSESVVVTGTPTLDIIIGGTTRQASYQGGSATDTLGFLYIVQAGDVDMDGIALGTLTGTINDVAGNNAVLTLPVVNTTGVLVNTNIPGVAITTAATSPLNQPFTATITFTELVNGFVAGDITVTNATLSAFQTTDNITYTVLVTPVADGAVTLLVPANVAVNAGNNNNTVSNILSRVYDGTAPTITALDVPANGTYHLGDGLQFKAHFSEPIVVTGTPTLNITIGSTTRQATYQGGSATDTLGFLYIVQAGDVDMDGIVLGVLTGTINDVAGNNAVLTLPAVNTTGVLVNTAIPGVAISAAATSPLHEPFTATITFTELVNGFVAGDITATNATLSAFQTTDNITYTVLVTPVADGTVTLEVPANVAVNVGNNNNTASNILSRIYDGTAPTITALDVPANGTYHLGDGLRFKAHFSESVVVAGTPTLNIIIGSTTRQATYQGGSATDTLGFLYIVQAGDVDLNGVVLGAITGNIKDLSGNSAVGTIPVLNTTGILVNTTNPGVVISTTATSPVIQPFTATITFSEVVNGFTMGDITSTNATLSAFQTTDNITYSVLVTPTTDGAVTLQVPASVAVNVGNNSNTASNTLSLVFAGTAPVITAVDVPANAIYRLGQVLSFTVHYNEVVNVTGAASLEVIIGNTNRQATLVSGSGSNALLFSYTVQQGDMDMNGITLGTALSGTIRNTAGKDALLTLNNVGNTTGVLVNTTNPGVVISTTATSPVIQPFTATITFSEVVNGFTVGDITSTNATLSAFQTTDNITYTVLVTPPTDGAVTLQVPASVAVNVGNNGNTASNTLSLVFAGTAPVITAVDVPANAIYRLGQVLSFTVHYNEVVNVTGAASLEVIIGNTNRQATLVSGSGSNALLFSYTVQQGDMDMNGITLGTALSGTIRNTAGKDALLTLNNVGNTTGVLVNTTNPGVVISTTATSPVIQPFTATITFSEVVNGFTVGDITSTNATLSAFQTTDNITYSVLVTPTTDGAVTLQVPANVAVNVGNNGNTTSNTLSLVFAGTAPVITAVDVPANAIYRLGQVLSFTVHYNEVVNVTGAASLEVIIGNTNRQATLVSGSGSNALLFSYTIQQGDMDLDGITPGTTLSGTIRNTAGKDALLTLNNVGNTSGVLVNTRNPSVVLSGNIPARVNATVTIHIAFSELVNGLTSTGVVASNATISGLQTADHINYTVVLTPLTDGVINVHIPAGAAVNSGNNENIASNTLSFVYDATPPVISKQNFDINFNSPAGTAAGTLTATDAAGTIQDWMITADGSGGAFAIDATGTITVKDAAILSSKAGTSVSVTVTVSDGLNTSVPATILINVSPAFVNKTPTLDAIADAANCAGTETHTIQLTGMSAVEPDQTYNLTVTADQAYFDVLTVDNAGVLHYQFKSNISSGNANVTVIIKDNGGTANGAVDTRQRSFRITINTLPAVTISSNKGSTVSKGDIIQLTATGGNNYHWTTVDGIISGQQSAVLQARIMVNTTYEVTATNTAGCNNTGRISIAVVEDFKVESTNILTPNGDGKNDRWVIRNLDSYPDNEVKIFDRAGRIVYQRRNYSNDWDGTVNGSPLSEGTYYYILTINGNTKTAKGYITIIRDQQ